MNSLVSLETVASIEGPSATGKGTAELAQVVEANLMGAQLNAVGGHKGTVRFGASKLADLKLHY